jgi:hypothetical protein
MIAGDSLRGLCGSSACRRAKEALKSIGEIVDVLYRRADHQNPKWTVRLKIPNTDGFVVKSTKTTDDFEARRLPRAISSKIKLLFSPSRSTVRPTLSTPQR